MATTTTTRRRGGKSKPLPIGTRTIGQRLRELRVKAGVSQEAIGNQGFVSAPGWIKIENGQRSPSEKLLAELVSWLVKEKVVPAGVKTALIEELCAIKYAAHRSPFLAMLARNYLAALPPGEL